MGRREQRRPARSVRRQLSAVGPIRQAALRDRRRRRVLPSSLLQGTAYQLFLNQGDGTFKDVSKEWGIRDHVGKGMGVGMADYDLDGKPDLFVTNDAGTTFCFITSATSSKRSPSRPDVALAEDGGFISGMGTDFRDFNNDGFPDIVYVALRTPDVPDLPEHAAKATSMKSPLQRHARTSLGMSGFGAGTLRLRQRRLEGPLRHPRTCRVSALPGHTSPTAQHCLPQSRHNRQVASSD